MQIAICDDTQKDLNQLKEILEDYLKTAGLSANIDVFDSAEAFMESFSQKKYLIIFMDIFMSKGNISGFEAAKQIRELDFESALIFTSVSTEFAISGYDVANYYIVKPVTKSALAKAMSKCREHQAQLAKTLEIIVNRQTINLHLHDIYYVETRQRACVFSTSNGEYICKSMAFETIANMLCDSPFLRCHRSYIVNLTHVQAMKDKDFIMSDSTRIPISRSAMPQAQSEFRKHLAFEISLNKQ